MDPVRVDYDHEELLGIAEVAERMQVSLSTIRRWRKHGLPYIHINSRIDRYRWSDIEKWLKSRAENPV